VTNGGATPRRSGSDAMTAEARPKSASIAGRRRWAPRQQQLGVSGSGRSVPRRTCSRLQPTGRTPGTPRCSRSTAQPLEPSSTGVAFHPERPVTRRTPRARRAAGTGRAAGAELLERGCRSSAGMTVRRSLPKARRRTVGAWCFVDHFGPLAVGARRRHRHRPHPHTGLATVTYLLDGRCCTATASAASRSSARASSTS
jgi:hypothetical protein